MAEVDYLYAHAGKIYPVEVKAGPSSRAKSLQVFLNEKKKSTIGIHFSETLPEFNRKMKMLRLPFYMIGELPRILDEIHQLPDPARTLKIGTDEFKHIKNRME
jgi:hypothetical protein